MKKTLLNLVAFAALGVAFGQAPGLNAVAAFDDFKDGTVFVPGNNAYSVLTEEIYWNDTTKQAVISKKAYKGIYWWEKGLVGLDFAWMRNDGKLSYSAVNQAESKYEPLGVGFGTYASSATADTATPFTVDLSNNKKLSLTIANTSTTDMEFRVGLQDINGNMLNGMTRNAAGTELTTEVADANGAYANVYMYEILFTIAAGASRTFNYDFDSSSYIYYTTLTPNSTTECENQGHYKTIATSGFDFTKVKGITITPLNAAGTGIGDFPQCWGKLALAAGTFDITDFKLGDVSTIVASISDDVINNFKNEVVTVYNITGSVVATGDIETLNLQSGFYILKSASKTQKVVIK